jgi:hypothetical protein
MRIKKPLTFREFVRQHEATWQASTRRLTAQYPGLGWMDSNNLLGVLGELLLNASKDTSPELIERMASAALAVVAWTDEEKGGRR